MSVWQILGLIFVAGGVGGLVNSLINDKGLALPRAVPKGDGTSILLPGFIGNMLIGSVAASVSWLLYSPFGQSSLITSNQELFTQFAQLGGAVLVGMTGSGWLANAVDKTVLLAAVTQAAAAPSSPEAARQMSQLPPAGVLTIAQTMKEVQPATLHEKV